jgi:hypothetical protein
VFIRAGLVFGEYVNITIIPGGGFQTVEHVVEILAEVILDKAA